MLGQSPKEGKQQAGPCAAKISEGFSCEARGDGSQNHKAGALSYFSQLILRVTKND
jgi:hypothetical protein